MAKQKPDIPPAELRIAEVGWNTLLDQWERQVLFLYKRAFYRYGLTYGLKGYMDHRVDENTRLYHYAEFVYDSLTFPPESEYDRIEGERRLNEYASRLKRLKEMCDFKMEIDDIALMQNSLRFPPAAEEIIQQAEARLGVRLPPAYREFVAISNGWLIEHEVSIAPVETVGPLVEVDPGYIKNWSQHEFIHEAFEIETSPIPLAQGENFMPSRNMDIPTASLASMLVIGRDETESAFLLLDPSTRDKRGEWRAISIFRYEYAMVVQDFARLMEILYRFNAKIDPN